MGSLPPDTPCVWCRCAGATYIPDGAEPPGPWCRVCLINSLNFAWLSFALCTGRPNTHAAVQHDEVLWIIARFLCLPQRARGSAMAQPTDHDRTRSRSRNRCDRDGHRKKDRQQKPSKPPTAAPSQAKGIDRPSLDLEAGPPPPASLGCSCTCASDEDLPATQEYSADGICGGLRAT